MQEIIINKDRLKDSDVTDVIEKSRIVLRNEENEFILVRFGRVYFLPGGKIENEETPVDTIKREVMEETNINVLLDDIEPFVLVKHYLKDYELNDGTVVNRLINTYYFTGFTTKDNIEYFNLTTEEKHDQLRAFFINMEEAKELLHEYNKENPKATYLAKETTRVLNLYNENEENILK
jgi:8-oxo-dGTP pyrophosphatase MutT (NUDIX family)